MKYFARCIHSHQGAGSKAFGHEPILTTFDTELYFEEEDISVSVQQPVRRFEWLGSKCKNGVIDKLLMEYMGDEKKR